MRQDLLDHGRILDAGAPSKTPAIEFALSYSLELAHDLQRFPRVGQEARKYLEHMHRLR
jgi:hypothetical protein